MIACIVPMRDTYAAEVAKIVGRVPQAGWNQLRTRIGREGTVENVEVGFAIGTVLRKRTFPNSRRFLEVGGGRAGGVASASPQLRLAQTGSTSNSQAQSSCPGPTPCKLGTVSVTAGYNYALIDAYAVQRLFNWYGESSSWSWEREYWLEQHSQLCEEWNQTYQQWYATKEQVAWAANEGANEVDALLAQINQTSSQIENEEYTCKRVPGKPLCIDSFISNCRLVSPPHPMFPDGIQFGSVGDCRDFNPDADWSQSRAQIYVDPVSLQFEIKYNSTWFIFGPHLREHDDSVKVCKDGSCVQVNRIDGGPPGSFRVELSLLNSVCAWVDIICPSIDAEVRFYPDASKPGGYDVHFDRDSYPSFGVYMEGPSGFTTMKEDRERARNLYEAFLRLFGAYRSTAENVPPPSNPNGCAVT